MIYSKTPPELSPSQAAINQAYLADEDTHLNKLVESISIGDANHNRIQDLARHLVSKVREKDFPNGGIDAFLHEYDLSSQEGVMLMCLAEALLRIPDTETADRLIRDKISQAEWGDHLGQSPSLFVNASTWGLLLTGRVVQLAPNMINNLGSFMGSLISRSGEPMIRMAMKQAMTIIGHQFVMGRTIDEAIERGSELDNKIYRYSFDMLGETALTAADAERYLLAYSVAIKTISQYANNDNLFDNPGISVKLSALHPRYEVSKKERVLKELTPRLLQLAQEAKAANINLTIDAEEADRLDLSLELFSEVYNHPLTNNWNGLGLAVQAYQKRAFYIIDWLKELSEKQQKQIPVRLVKGAYWDTEIKHAQEQGLEDYPVFTRKTGTDVSYLACAQKILSAGELFYPQFATHNAHTVSSIIVMAGTQKYEFQRLHGMGEALFSIVLDSEKLASRCRVYAPVGSHKDLLPYLVRRLLENGANTSFVNRIIDEQAPIEKIIADPIVETEILKEKRHPHIPLPRHLYGAQRLNANGINLSDPTALTELDNALEEASKKEWQANPIINGESLDGNKQNILDPSDQRRIVGEVITTNITSLEQAITNAYEAALPWSNSNATYRAEILEKTAQLLEQHRIELMALCIREAGRTISDALSEVREAIDFCRYYAAMARDEFAEPRILPGVTGESNELWLTGRGVFVCISPWNFPGAIFTGQIAAALAAGNCVIAKPAGLTPLAAHRIIQLFHQAGIPNEVLYFTPGSGSEIGMTLVDDPRIAGVAFTGSTQTACQINQALAKRKNIIPLIAETGGQNAMIVDSSALPEQVVHDAITSAFNSAGQRCSALRVLFVQQDIAPRVLEMLGGAMDELTTGDPALLETDIGPVISSAAKNKLQQHADRMDKEARLIKTLSLNTNCEHGNFFAPRAYEIDSLNQLQGEVFGPILHIIQYQANKLDGVINSINNTGYGLTLGIHTRVNATAEYISKNVRCGNAYVNRNMIGAVVGSQPFGGEGLSGTGFKAGGPHYLHRFATERVLTVNTAAVGGNATLLSLDAEKTELPQD